VGGRDLVAGELTVGGRARGFRLRLPRSANGGIPLVLVLHGNHPDAGGWLMRDWTTFDKQADAWGLAVAYPDGYGGCWADGRGVTTADEAGVDDVAFLRAIIDWSAQRHRTLPDRTVVAGISNGAFMAHRLGLEASDQVAVLADVAGGLPARLRDVRPTHAVSAMLIQTTDDTISPIGGGYSRHRGPDRELRSAAATPGRARPPRRGSPTSAPRSLTRPRRSAASPGPCSRPRTAGGSDPTHPARRDQSQCSASC
jgi:polyhydroxybutyrate depolymerase